MKNKSDNPKLNKRDIEILKNLQSSPKRFGDIHNTSGIHRNLLSNSLKKLQKMGLVNRDIETKEYKAEKISIEKLFYFDLLDFLQEQMGRDVNTKDTEKKPIISSLDWFATTDFSYVDFYELLKTQLEKPENKNMLNDVGQLMYETWENYVLSSRKLDEQQRIIHYKRYLLELQNLLSGIERLDSESDFFKSIAHLSLKNEFPKLEKFSENSLYIEASRIVKKAQQASDMINQPRDLEDLKYILNSAGFSNKKFNEEEEQKGHQILDFLVDEKNKQVYESYLKSLENEPKTILLFPLLGFRGYRDKMKELFSEKIINSEAKNKKNDI